MAFIVTVERVFLPGVNVVCACLDPVIACRGGIQFSQNLAVQTIENAVEASHKLLGTFGNSSPFLLVGILIIACNRTIMQKQPSSLVNRVVVAVTALLMFGAAIGMFVF